MTNRIQQVFHARTAVFALMAAFALVPAGLQAGGEDPPHGRPGMGGDVALRGGQGDDGRGGRPEEGRRVAPREADDPLDGMLAAIEHWLVPSR